MAISMASPAASTLSDFLRMQSISTIGQSTKNRCGFNAMSTRPAPAPGGGGSPKQKKIKDNTKKQGAGTLSCRYARIKRGEDICHQSFRAGNIEQMKT